MTASGYWGCSNSDDPGTHSESKEAGSDSTITSGSGGAPPAPDADGSDDDGGMGAGGTSIGSGGQPSSSGETDAGVSTGAAGDAGPGVASEGDASSISNDSGVQPVGLDPYGRCDLALGGDGNPQCPGAESLCNGSCIPGRCETDLAGGALGTGDDCPAPLTGNADPECNFGYCTLACSEELICPDGMFCRGSYCDWPDE